MSVSLKSLIMEMKMKSHENVSINNSSRFCIVTTMMVSAFLSTVIIIAGYFYMTPNAMSGERKNDEPRIMCLIISSKKSIHAQRKLKNSLEAVRLTWAQRCNYQKFFYSNLTHANLDGAYALDTLQTDIETTLEALRLSHEADKDVDWYIKATDNTYIVVENMRDLLAGFDPDQPLYLGRKKTKDIQDDKLASGESSFALSRAAVSAIDKVKTLPMECSRAPTNDTDMSTCFKAFGISSKDTRDEEGRQRFQTTEQPEAWARADSSGLSPSTVSFSQLDRKHMYMFDFMLYKLQQPLYNDTKC